MTRISTENKTNVSTIAKYTLSLGETKDTEYIQVRSPYNGELVAEIAQADSHTINLAIKESKHVFESVMKKLPAHRRSDILLKTSQLIELNKEDLARTIALESGKAIKDACIEVSRASMTFKIASEECLRLNGEEIAMDRQAGNEGRLGFVLREPIGIIAAITPFNFPLNLVAHKIAPAIAAGCTVLLKPASQTPVSSFKLAQLLKEAGLPENALILVPCRGSQANTLVTSNEIAMLTFTGSQEVGWRLRKEIAPGTRIILELGGNAGLVVHKDADIDAAVLAAARGGFANAGQTCISVQRIYVHQEIYNEFLSKFSAKVQNLELGDPCSESTDIGPMIDKSASEKTLTWIDEAVKNGSKIECGGKLLNNNIVEPTILSVTDENLSVVCQEVFGPIVSLMSYQNIDDVIKRMNNSRYGLQAGVFTSNLELAFKLARSIDAGGVIVNDSSSFRADHMPYGGRKESGIGLEGVRYAIAEMTQPKFICLNLPSL